MLKKHKKPINYIEISKSAILNNLKIYQDNNPDSYVFPCLKSNAYGHGIDIVYKILAQKKIEMVCVNDYSEAKRIRKIRKSQKILLLKYPDLSNFRKIIPRKLRFTVYDKHLLNNLSKFPFKIKIHIKIDTGMNRQGIKLHKIESFIDLVNAYKNIEIEGIYSHLSSADNEDNIFTEAQVNNFIKAVEIVKSKGIKPKYIHLANSSGALKIYRPEFNAIRIGLGLYGYNPLSEKDDSYEKGKNLKPCLKYTSTIIQTKKVKIGESIGYGNTYKFTNNSKIALIPVGYYEGVDRRLSNIGYFSKEKNLYHIRGRISMNFSTIDILTDQLIPGDKITIINHNLEASNSVAKISQQCNTIPYIITTKIPSEIPRFISL